MGIVEGSQAWLESTPSCYEHRSDCLSEEGHWAEWELSWNCHKNLRLKKGKTILSPFFNLNGCKPEWRVMQIWRPRGSRVEGWGSYSERSTKTQRGQEVETLPVCTGELEETKPAISMAWNHLGWYLKNTESWAKSTRLCVCVCTRTYGACVCADVKPWCKLSFLLTLTLWSPLLPTLCSQCKQTNQPFLDFCDFSEIHFNGLTELISILSKRLPSPWTVVKAALAQESSASC